MGSAFAALAARLVSGHCVLSLEKGKPPVNTATGACPRLYPWLSPAQAHREGAGAWGSTAIGAGSSGMRIRRARKAGGVGPGLGQSPGMGFCVYHPACRRMWTGALSLCVRAPLPPSALPSVPSFRTGLPVICLHEKTTIQLAKVMIECSWWSHQLIDAFDGPYFPELINCDAVTVIAINSLQCSFAQSFHQSSDTIPSVFVTPCSSSSWYTHAHRTLPSLRPQCHGEKLHMD